MVQKVSFYIFLLYVFLERSCNVKILPTHDAEITNHAHRRFEIAQPSDDEYNENWRKLVVHYTFDSKIADGKKITDESGFDNNGMIDDGAVILEPKGSTCKSAAYLWDHDIRIPSSPFQHPPRSGISIAMWLKLEGHENMRRIFCVHGLRFGSLFLTVNVNQIIWSHIQQRHENYFTLQAQADLPHHWFHLTATYNCTTGIAIIYVNGTPLNRTISMNASIFEYWGSASRIGGHYINEPIKGFIDEFRMYNYALTSKEVERLARSCTFPTSDAYSKREEIEAPEDGNPDELISHADDHHADSSYDDESIE